MWPRDKIERRGMKGDKTSALKRIGDRKERIDTKSLLSRMKGALGCQMKQLGQLLRPSERAGGTKLVPENERKELTSRKFSRRRKHRLRACRKRDYRSNFFATTAEGSENGARRVEMGPNIIHQDCPCSYNICAVVQAT